MKQQDAASVINHLKNLFCKHGTPAKMLIDNDTVFHSKLFRDFLSEWGVGVGVIAFSLCACPFR